MHPLMIDRQDSNEEKLLFVVLSQRGATVSHFLHKEDALVHWVCVHERVDYFCKVVLDHFHPSL